MFKKILMGLLLIPLSLFTIACNDDNANGDDLPPTTPPIGEEDYEDEEDYESNTVDLERIIEIIGQVLDVFIPEDTSEYNEVYANSFTTSGEDLANIPLFDFLSEHLTDEHGVADSDWAFEAEHFVSSLMIFSMIIELPSFEPNVWTYFHYEEFDQTFYLSVHFDHEVLTLNFINNCQITDGASYEEIMIKVLDDNSFIIGRWMVSHNPDEQRTATSYEEAIILDGEVIKSSSIFFMVDDYNEVIEINVTVLDFINEYAFIGRLNDESYWHNVNVSESRYAANFVIDDLDISKSSAESLFYEARSVAEYNPQLGIEFIDLMNSLH